ncbi:hypothetical protein AB0P21_09660 [Kribbella sp. NPDC056861]|uniref:hypothetical protein n=1 Tax=Kribbella sp. NPDC056861 TaxID=3154857 RepID=UPI003422B553
MKTRPRYYTLRRGHHNVRPWGELTIVGEVIHQAVPPYRWQARLPEGRYLPDARTTYTTREEAAEALLKEAGYE